jgi:primosomal protein N' (replication factor Y)
VALTAAARHDFEGFAASELAARRDPAYPPTVGLVNVLVTGARETAVADAAVALAEWLRGAVVARAPGVEVVGPAPAPLARIRGRWRWHVLLRARDRALLGRLTRYTARRAPLPSRGGLRLAVDRDPVSLL